MITEYFTIAYQTRLKQIVTTVENDREKCTCVLLAGVVRLVFGFVHSLIVGCKKSKRKKCRLRKTSVIRMQVIKQIVDINLIRSSGRFSNST